MSTNRRLPLLIAIVVIAATLVGCSGGAAASKPAGATPQAASGRPSSTPRDALVPEMPSPAARASDVPSRVVVADLGIDLPVISGDVTLPGNAPDYPLCNVAQYLTTFPYPGRPGTTTWIYSHAREGMFLALLEASERKDGAELIGQTVDVFSTANVRYRYRITEVVRHATDRSTAQGVPADQGRLILQTSEGPRGTVPKLQVVAILVGRVEASASEAQPEAKARVCAIR